MSSPWIIFFHRTKLAADQIFTSKLFSLKLTLVSECACVTLVSSHFIFWFCKKVQELEIKWSEADFGSFNTMLFKIVSRDIKPFSPTLVANVPSWLNS